VDEFYNRPDPQKANPPVLWFQEAVQAPGLASPTGIIGNLIVSRGDVRTGKTVQSSVIFANGNVTVQGYIGSSVIVSDGDVTVLDRDISQSLVVARGNIKVKGFASGATLIAGGKITVETERKVVVESQYNVIKENELNPLGYITFFELSRIGLEVKAADQLVTLSGVTAGSTGAKAGLKVGDTILEVNGKKPDSAESLRQLLRDSLAIGDATVKLQRGDKTETVKVALPE
jgi:S1-C subfamily serine protease